MWSFDSFAKWVVTHPFQIKSSRKLNNVRDTTPAYQIESDVQALTFGVVRVGKSTHLHMVRVTNTGYKTVSIPKPMVPSDYEYVGPGETLLEPGAELTMGVRFSPKTEGEKTGVLLIHVDPIGTISVNLSGYGKPYSFIYNGLFRHNGTQHYNGDAQ